MGRNGPRTRPCISIYDTNLELIDQGIYPTLWRNDFTLLTSRIKRIGNHYLIATMGRDPADSFPLDTGMSVMVVVNDFFEVQEWHQVSFNDPQETGGMRPWFDVYEDQVILGYDKANQLLLVWPNDSLEVFENGPDTEPSSEPSGEPSSEPSTEPNANLQLNLLMKQRSLSGGIEITPTALD